MELDVNALKVINNPAAKRFEIDLGGGQLAVLEYLPGETTITYHHTEVPTAFEGRGLANKLAEHAMLYAQENGLKVNALCPIVKRYVGKHTEFQPITWGF